MATRTRKRQKPDADDVSITFPPWNKQPDLDPKKGYELLDNLRLLREEQLSLAKRADELAEREYNESVHFKDFINSGHDIEIIKKDNVFKAEINEQEMDIIQRRVEAQRKCFEEYERRDRARRIRRIRAIAPHATEAEAQKALEECENDEEQAAMSLCQRYFFQFIRKIIAQGDHEVKGDVVGADAAEKILAKARSANRIGGKRKATRIGRLRLDDALAKVQEAAQGSNEIPTSAFEGWSEARIKAYSLIKTNPNAYYYRFNAPGEQQRNGEWTPEEEKLFFDRLAEMGANGQWGIFSMKIPGRVGYQCSNYYRRLLEKKIVNDPNYYFDEKGKAKYKFGTRLDENGNVISSRGGRRPTNGDGVVVNQAKRKAFAKRKRRKGGRRGGDDDDDDDDDDDSEAEPYSVRMARVQTSRASRARRGETGDIAMDGDAPETDGFEANDDGEESNKQNPLPGFIDPITLDEVVKPAISPYGHVMGYENWVRCLSNPERKNICPLTKKPLTKRQLVILTWENIDEYRSKIVAV